MSDDSAATYGRLVGIVLAVVVTVTLVVVFSGEPEPKPVSPQTTPLKAEELGEKLGDRSHRFGDGFLKGWRGVTHK